MLQSNYPPDEEAEVPDPMTTTEIRRKMMTTLPNGFTASQLKSEHPNATYQEFLRAQIAESARPKSMPLIKAMCDASNSNFASGKLDNITYYDYLDVDIDDCDDLVCDKLFDRWFDAAIFAFGWLGGNPDAVGPSARSHVWDWPTHKVADEKAQALANREKLASGQVLLPQLYSQAGLDFEDEVARAASSLGITPEELKTRLLDASLPPVKVPGAEQEPDEPEGEPTPAADAYATTNRLNGYLNGHANGVH